MTIVHGSACSALLGNTATTWQLLRAIDVIHLRLWAQTDSGYVCCDLCVSQAKLVSKNTHSSKQRDRLNLGSDINWSACAAGVCKRKPCALSNADLSAPQKVLPDKSAHDFVVCSLQRKVGPEVQSALAMQQVEQTQDMAVLQAQLDGLKSTLNQQKAAAQKMVQVRARLLLAVFLSHCYKRWHAVNLVRCYSHHDCAQCNIHGCRYCVSCDSSRYLHQFHTNMLLLLLRRDNFCIWPLLRIVVMLYKMYSHAV